MLYDRAKNHVQPGSTSTRISSRLEVFIISTGSRLETY